MGDKRLRLGPLETAAEAAEALGRIGDLGDFVVRVFDLPPEPEPPGTFG